MREETAKDDMKCKTSKAFGNDDETRGEMVSKVVLKNKEVPDDNDNDTRGDHSDTSNTDSADETVLKEEIMDGGDDTGGDHNDNKYKTVSKELKMDRGDNTTWGGKVETRLEHY